MGETKSAARAPCSGWRMLACCEVCVARQSASPVFIYAAVNNTVGYPVCTLMAQSLIASAVSSLHARHRSLM